MERGRPLPHRHHHHHHCEHPNMPPMQYAHTTPSSSREGRGEPSDGVEHFRWNGGSGGGGAGGGNSAQCSISCSRDGLVMTYCANPPPPPAPCPLCTALAAAATPCPYTHPIQPAPQPTPDPATTRSLCEVSRGPDAAASRSLTFSGSLDRSAPKPAQQRPYGRRCKSTAHIVLQNTEQPTPPPQRPHEFHATSAPAPPRQEPRGRAKHRPTPHTQHVQPGAGGAGWEQGDTAGVGGGAGAGGSVGGSCSCHHCSTLYSLVTSLACPCHHHHHHHCGGQQGVGVGGRPTTRSPTIRTFDSHSCYDHSPAPHSPKPTRRRSPPSPSPERRGKDAAPPHPHTSPQAQRRVPRMGAAAAAAAATPAAQVSNTT